MRRLPFLLVWAAMAVPVSTTAQDVVAERVDPAIWAAVAPVLEAAVRDSLPVDALRGKVLEGAAKRVPPDRIRAVVEQMAGEFRTVRAAVRERNPGFAMDPGEIVASAMALRQGIPVESVLHVWEVRPPESGSSVEVPLVVMTEIVRRGVELPEAEALVTHVVANRVPGQLAAQIPGRMERMMSRPGAKPAAALEAALRALNIPRPPGRGPRR